MRVKAADKLFQERFRILSEFQKEHGHCRVPKAYEKCPQLNQWIRLQIQHFHDNHLPAEQAEALEAIGIDFYPVIPYSEEDVRQRLAVLARFQVENRTKAIPTRSERDPEYVALVQWLVRMRRNIKGGLVSDIIISMLIGAGIDVERRSAGNGLRVQETEAFDRNFTVLKGWLQKVERNTGQRDLSYQDAQRDQEARTAYRFVEHMLQKRRQNVLAQRHLQQLISLAFTVNGRRWFTSRMPGPSIRSEEHLEERRYSW